MIAQSNNRSRAAILNRIKHALHDVSSSHEAPQPTARTLSDADQLTLKKIFTQAARANGAAVIEIASLGAVVDLVRERQSTAGSTLPLSIAPQKELEVLAWKAGSPLQLEDDYKNNHCNGLVVAECAAAETGTVVISTHSCPSGLLFLTERLFILLRTTDIKPDYESVWAVSAGKNSAARPRTLHLISGPSRTADVEQTIQIGAHGPRQLDILLLVD